jgi:hypothetical protein
VGDGFKVLGVVSGRCKVKRFRLALPHGWASMKERSTSLDLIAEYA